MRRILRTASAVGVLLLAAGTLVVSTAPAAIAPQEIKTYPYRHLVASPEVVVTATGGPGVVLADQIKDTVVVRYGGGGPCGSLGPPPEAEATNTGTPRRSDSASGGGNVWLLVGSVGVVVGGLVLVGFALARRSRV